LGTVSKVETEPFDVHLYVCDLVT